MPTRSTVHVALLRGINVGGKNKLPMKTLVELLEAAGCEDVRTYIQSGNAVFRAPPAAGLADDLRARIRRRTKLEVPVVLRTGAELETVQRRNPFAREAPESLHVAFLADAPGRAAAARLDPTRSPGDRFELRGRELYLHLPNGVARTKLTNAWLDRVLETTSTVRNWRTVGILAQMAREARGPEPPRRDRR